MPCPAAAQDYKGKRVDVEDHQVPWEYRWPDYAPRSYTAALVLANGRDMPDGQKWADPADPSLLREELEARITYLGTSGSGDGGGGTSGGGSGDGGPSATPVSRASSGVSRGGSGSIRRGSGMAGSPTCPFAPGDLVRHKDRGIGSVSDLLSDGRMPVLFENGETHRYKPSSWHKFELVEKANQGSEEEKASVVFGGGMPLAQVEP